MNQIIIDKKTLMVSGCNRNARAFEFEVTLPIIENFKKIINQTETSHKTNILGNKLFKITIGNKTYQVPENELSNRQGTPIIETISKQKEIYFYDNVTAFSLQDILKIKADQLIQQSNYENCQLFEVDLDNSINLKYEDHKADTGYKIIKIHPKSNVKVNVINFITPKPGDPGPEKIQVHFESDMKVNLKYCFDGDSFQPLLSGNIIENKIRSDKLYLIFYNDSDLPVSITSYNLLY